MPALTRLCPACFPLAWMFASLLLLTFPQTGEAQIDFGREPINYESQPPQDRIAKLIEALEAGQESLEYREQGGYLPDLLQKLEVPASSQTLVFSKTSLQLHKITPSRPRALYFSDDVYVGWVQDGDVIELSAVDPEQGAIFYTLDQVQGPKPVLVRDKGQCLSCHASSRTENVPGYLLRSVFADRRGQPQYGSGTYTIDQTSPFEQRYGGWYVTGEHGSLRHMGNVFSQDRLNPENIDREAGANLTSLDALVDVSPYLQPTSDLVALLVLGHQAQMHNLITRANYEARHSLHYDQAMNKALERPADFQSELTQRRIASTGEKLLQYLLYSEEFPLAAPIKGNSPFATEFAQLGPGDKQGRSLRDFDLSTRMFRYPCSFLIYSPSFEALPGPMKAYVTRRLWEVLSGQDQSKAFAHLSAEDRTAIREILQDTKPELFAEIKP